MDWLWRCGRRDECWIQRLQPARADSTETPKPFRSKDGRLRPPSRLANSGSEGGKLMQGIEYSNEN